MARGREAADGSGWWDGRGSFSRGLAEVRARQLMRAETDVSDRVSSLLLRFFAKSLASNLSYASMLLGFFFPLSHVV